MKMASGSDHQHISKDTEADQSISDQEDEEKVNHSHINMPEADGEVENVTAHSDVYGGREGSGRAEAKAASAMLLGRSGFCFGPA